jgi:Na+/proline symporter
VVIVGLVATFFGLMAPSILSQIVGAMQIRAVAGLLVIICIFWKRLDSTAAFWSLLFGGLVAIAWHFMGSPFGILALWPATLVFLVILIPMVLVSKKGQTKGHAFVEQSIKELVESDKQETLAKS